jgi:hypothetical protein
MTKICEFLKTRTLCPFFLYGSFFCLENKLKMLISDNERSRQEINADHRHG